MFFPDLVTMAGGSLPPPPEHLIPPPDNRTQLHIVNSPGFSGRLTLTGIGNHTVIQARMSRGTFEAPTAVEAGGVITSFNAQAWIPGFGFEHGPGSNRVAISLHVAEEWTYERRGTAISFTTTKIGTALERQVAWITDAGQFLLWSKEAYPLFGDESIPSLQVHGIGSTLSNATATPGIGIARWGPDNTQVNLILAKSRGEINGHHVIVQHNDSVGIIRWTGSDGAKFQNVAGMRAIVDGVPGLGNVPGRFELQTSNGATLLTRLIFDSRDNIVLGSGALALGQVDGGIHIPYCDGVPTAVPREFVGRVNLRYDRIGKKLYAYAGGAWSPV